MEDGVGVGRHSIEEAFPSKGILVGDGKGRLGQRLGGEYKGGLTAKISNSEARKAFSDRHNCPDKKDKTSPGYWSCNLPRHWSKIGGGEDINSYW